MRIYLAATADLYDARVTCDVKHLLLSYMGAEARMPVAIKSAGSPDDWCLDSGAHFFLGAFYKKHEKLPLEKVEEHLHKLVAYVNGLEEVPRFVVELDLQDLYGMERIWQWRDEIWKPLERQTGSRVAYVWHPGDGEAEWKRLLDDPAVQYLGLATPRAFGSGQAARYVMQAYEAGKPVHGFACVRERLLKAVPFYSVDSTSWGAGSMFGLVTQFNMLRGTICGKPAGKALFRKDRNKAAANLLANAHGKVRLSDMLNSNRGEGLSRSYQDAVRSYEEMEAFYSAYWRCRGVDWDKRLADRAYTPAARVTKSVQAR